MQGRQNFLDIASSKQEKTRLKTSGQKKKCQNEAFQLMHFLGTYIPIFLFVICKTQVPFLLRLRPLPHAPFSSSYYSSSWLMSDTLCIFLLLFFMSVPLTFLCMHFVGCSGCVSLLSFLLSSFVLFLFPPPTSSFIPLTGCKHKEVCKLSRAVFVFFHLW